MEEEYEKRLLDRIATRVVVDPETGCHLWTGRINNNGYGEIKVGKYKRLLVHRLVMELNGVDLPPGIQVCHQCDVRHCCNLKHLLCGTMQDNQRDKVNKGRHCYKVKDETVLRIFTMRASNLGQREIAESLGLSLVTVARILVRKTYADVEVDDDLVIAAQSASCPPKGRPRSKPKEPQESTPRKPRSGTKLCEADILEMFRLRSLGVKRREIAKMFNIGIPYIKSIWSRKNWARVTIPEEYLRRRRTVQGDS